MVLVATVLVASITGIIMVSLARTLGAGFLLLVAVAVLRSPADTSLDAGAAKPPVAKKVPKTTLLHGETLVDDYYWLREKSNSEVIAHLEAENAYTSAIMKPAEPFQTALYKEMLGRIKQTDLSVPYKLGDYWYYSRTEE